MDIEVTITNIHPKELMGEFGDGKSISSGSQVGFEQGGTITYSGSIMQRAVGAEEVALFILSIPTGVAVSVFGNYLFHKFFRPGRRITIRTREVEFEAGEIKKAIEEELKIEE